MDDRTDVSLPLISHTRYSNKGDDLQHYKSLILLALFLNSLMILMWLVYSGYQCYLGQKGPQREREPSRSYREVQSAESVSSSAQ